LSELAIGELFGDLGVTPTISRVGELTHYHSENIDIFVGDIFLLTPELLKPVDAVYDRAALVALPQGMRTQYTSHLIDITDAVPQLMICYEYDQRVIPGPPFSISRKEVEQHYASTYSLSLIECCDVKGGLKGKVAATELVWVIQP
jgi:thiopurine S-methyltransferase